jgi:hypothetical protein
MMVFYPIMVVEMKVIICMRARRCMEDFLWID